MMDFALDIMGIVVGYGLFILVNRALTSKK